MAQKRLVPELPNCSRFLRLSMFPWCMLYAVCRVDCKVEMARNWLRSILFCFFMANMFLKLVGKFFFYFFSYVDLLARFVGYTVDDDSLELVEYGVLGVVVWPLRGCSNWLTLFWYPCQKPGEANKS